MIVHQTEKIAGSTCGRLEDGWNNKPKVKREEKYGESKRKGMGWEMENVLMFPLLQRNACSPPLRQVYVSVSGLSQWEKAECQH